MEAKKTIGMDAGGSLIKLAYFEKGNLHLKKYSYQETDSLLNWLSLIAPDANIRLTGGRGMAVKGKFSGRITEITEFEAFTEGAVYLLEKEQSIREKGFIAVNIGTGTSLHFIKEGKSERLIGTGAGGGALLGLAALLLGTGDYQEVIKLSKNGDRSAVDLQVKDIYAPFEPPVPGYLTASNFGKVTHGKQYTREDIAVSLTGLIAETNMLLAVQAAQMKGTTSVVYFGGALASNGSLQEFLIKGTKLFGCEPLIPEQGEFCGAIGALIAKQL
ncbi:type II pantothenate kinase [Peribacillus saganii]|uniref:Type II pantothenate kinase n=1 Tax=Peribacillus saganii TaxID=2303992 RepID=A0A372LQA6_9BACI|nr:type II pantothenate kinase [Peribacillus saganii]RFU70395.1 type II pantothenate kinase [Peribacillus saganii]